MHIHSQTWRTLLAKHLSQKLYNRVNITREEKKHDALSFVFHDVFRKTHLHNAGSERLKNEITGAFEIIFFLFFSRSGRCVLGTEGPDWPVEEKRGRARSWGYGNPGKTPGAGGRLNRSSFPFMSSLWGSSCICCSQESRRRQTDKEN